MAEYEAKAAARELVGPVDIVEFLNRPKHAVLGPRPYSVMSSRIPKKPPIQIVRYENLPDHVKLKLN